MRSALLCVFFALIIHEEGSQASSGSDFRPIPIPLDQWNYEKREGRVETLQESINTEKPPSVVAVPAHYWEDALRHSVYLTLVRDKIDQLISKGLVVSHDTKLDHYESKEIDDHDLWEKIKNAPFDRIEAEDQPSSGDITIMAKGRLVEDNGGYRFTEDKQTKGNCTDDKCLEGVKAFWSVKRIRQRDEEVSPGRYHYELTFSVNSQKTKKKKKPHETPIRTFTVRETPPEIIVSTPQEQLYHQTARPEIMTARPQRAIWFHRNIAPSNSHSQARYHQMGLERIFSSFFSDDEPPVEAPRYKPNPYNMSPYPQYSKPGFMGLASDLHQHKKPMPYPYKPHYYKYGRPPLQAPPFSHPQHHYIDVDAFNNPPGPPPTDHRYISPSNIVKTTRPAVLPTPPATEHETVSNNITLEANSSNNDNVTENIINEPEIPPAYRPHHKPRPTQMKINYFPEHIRPPIYNAPPGVFTTMDKKPFKPMPPLKHVHSTKPFRKPIDFRPSPQVLDTHFSHQDATVDSFRPILVNFTENDDQEKNDQSQGNKQTNNHVRKQVSKKPPKKHENIKSHRITTSAPDIITVNNEFEDFNDTMQWANILGAFTKTTPMEPQKDIQIEPETTTEPIPSYSSTVYFKSTTEYVEEGPKQTTTTTTTTTTAAPKKRTRPPHKFAKPEKVKKHKRVTTTTTTIAPETNQIKKTSDLTPQASSAATGPNKTWQSKNKTLATTTTTSSPPSSSTTQTTTTLKPTSTTQNIHTTTSTPEPTTSAKIEEISTPAQEKSKNRFRQSTLMHKGTSVKHDRWSSSSNPVTEKKVTAAISGKQPPRRKGSNFQGYRPTKHSTHDEENNEQFHTGYTTEMSKRQETSTTRLSENIRLSTQPNYEETAEQYNVNSESTSAYSQNQNEEYQKEEDDDEHDDIEVKVKNDDEQGSEDHAEFIFDLTSTTPNDKTNEINEEEPTVTEQTVEAASHSVTKNKTRCKKKKKNDHLTPTKESVTEVNEPAPTTIIATTTENSGLDILDELLGSLSYESPKPKEKTPAELDEEGSENHEKYLNIDEDFDDFLGNLEEDRNRHTDESQKEDVEEEEEYEDEEKEPLDDDVSPFDNDDVNESSRNTSDKDYDEYHDRSYSLLELMAME